VPLGLCYRYLSKNLAVGIALCDTIRWLVGCDLLVPCQCGVEMFTVNGWMFTVNCRRYLIVVMEQ